MKKSKRALIMVIAAVLVFGLTAIPASAASRSKTATFLVDPYKGVCSLVLTDTEATAAMTVTAVGNFGLLPYVSFRIDGGATSDGDKEYFLNTDGAISLGNTGSCDRTRNVDEVGEKFIWASCDYYFNGSRTPNASIIIPPEQ